MRKRKPDKIRQQKAKKLGNPPCLVCGAPIHDLAFHAYYACAPLRDDVRVVCPCGQFWFGYRGGEKKIENGSAICNHFGTDATFEEHILRKLGQGGLSDRSA